ncbi:DUF2889 domain-containing protein [Ideonella azotifigens]|nr:DUF2889 domain-containing protein [Ideonella azotifigens]
MHGNGPVRLSPPVEPVMPLTLPAPRREVHHRAIDMRAFARDDGLFDVEARLVDRKPFPFLRASSPEPVPAGDPLHDLWVRITLDSEFVVRDIEASSDATPWRLCREAEGTLKVLIGEKVARGWSAKVKERLRGAAGCTHLMEMLVTLGTTALQGIRGADPERALAAPWKMDSCYAYGRERAVAKILWPEQAGPAATDAP